MYWVFSSLMINEKAVNHCSEIIKFMLKNYSGYFLKTELEGERVDSGKPWRDFGGLGER